jgi:NADPH2:quinone reductase
MRAILCRELSGLDGLQLSDIPDPGAPGAGQVRIRAAAAGLNFADLLISAGRYQVKRPPPFVPGFELAGIIESVGAGVSQFKPGDAVMAIPEAGAFAEVVVTAADGVYAVPQGMSLPEAAGFPIAYGTSYLALVEQARLQPGEILLVHGAAGGVGLTAVEIGKALGAQVIATAGGAEKCAVARAHGADRTIDYRSEDVRDRVKALAVELSANSPGGEKSGVDVVYDPVGGEMFDASLRAVNWNARILIVGFAGGGVPQIPANILLVKNVAVLGFYFGSWRQRRPEIVARGFTELNQMYGSRQLNPLVSHSFDLGDFRAGLQLIRDRKSSGKVVLLTGAATES